MLDGNSREAAAEGSGDYFDVERDAAMDVLAPASQRYDERI